MGKLAPAATPRFLFVYGTLLRGFASLESWQRRVRAEFAGRGRIKGKLCDLGECPGAIADSEHRVRGELYELKRPGDAVKILDEDEDECEDYFPLHPKKEFVCPHGNAGNPGRWRGNKSLSLFL